jgi:hypothetical protein
MIDNLVRRGAVSKASLLAGGFIGRREERLLSIKGRKT